MGAGFAGVHQHLVHATTITCAAALPPPYAASRRFFRTPPASPAYSNTSCVEQRSRVRRLLQRPTPLRSVSLYAACFAGVHQHLVRSSTIACAAASPSPYGAPAIFQVQSSEISA